MGEVDTLRKKVWKIINIIQANLLFVHSSTLELKFVDKKSKKVKTQFLPKILSLCVLNAKIIFFSFFLLNLP